MAKTELDPWTRPIDMSAEAIDQRLRDLAQLYRLGMSLGDVQRLGRAADSGGKSTGQRTPAAPGERRVDDAPL